ncbi:hypothetical protein MTR67_024345 [Solanum verrucosum]|uniref:Uncharacterized protein n=1 Tax=Solanum verrucosum TaxID=315347 RepID=A0AAF0R1H0_SOLVR|nr:hypothetical protein MTR67_024345 [Solanum verrucosum]
MSLRAPAGPF